MESELVHFSEFSQIVVLSFIIFSYFRGNKLFASNFIQKNPLQIWLERFVFFFCFFSFSTMHIIELFFISCSTFVLTDTSRMLISFAATKFHENDFYRVDRTFYLNKMEQTIARRIWMCSCDHKQFPLRISPEFHCLNGGERQRSIWYFGYFCCARSPDRFSKHSYR